MLDLGKEEDALQAWRDALSADPKHCATIYNQGLTQWRQSQITDDVLVEQLGSAQETQTHNWEANYLLALVHIERGDLDSASPLLEQALKFAPNESEVLRYLGAELRRPAIYCSLKRQLNTSNR